MPYQLLIIFHLHVIVGLLNIIIVVVGDTSGTDAKSSQLSRSQRDRWEDRDVRELKERLIPLTMDDLLVALKI
jgi:hypothetical protein